MQAFFFFLSFRGSESLKMQAVFFLSFRRSKSLNMQAVFFLTFRSSESLKMEAVFFFSFSGRGSLKMQAIFYLSFRRSESLKMQAFFTRASQERESKTASRFCFLRIWWPIYPGGFMVPGVPSGDRGNWEQESQRPSTLKGAFFLEKSKSGFQNPKKGLCAFWGNSKNGS